MGAAPGLRDRGAGARFLSFRLQESLEHLRPHIPAALITPDALADWCAFLADMPGRWGWGVLECRLAASDPRVDFMACAADLADQRRALLRALESCEHPALRPALPTLRAWARGASAALAHMPTYWLEWDRTADGFLPLSWACVEPAILGRKHRQTPEHVRAICAAMFTDRDGLRVAAAEAHLAELATSLPAEGRLLFVGSLRPRGVDAYRVFVRLPADRLRTWLSSAGWPGDLDAVDDWQSSAQPEGEPAFLQLETEGALRPHLGLETRQTVPGFRNRPSRERWLERAVRRGLACPAKARAVVDWHGADAVDLRGAGRVRLQRTFHTKLVLDPARGPSAKAYLGYCATSGAASANSP